jgi:prepilin-type N-terminal cleavage/methylation domain-containing protein
MKNSQLRQAVDRRVQGGRKGFTLVEIMIVVLIIGILLAIAVPNFIKARETSRSKSCVANLKQIEAAKEQWCMDNRQGSSASPGTADLYGTTNYVKNTPDCPSGGTYSIGDMSTRPTCSIGTGTTPSHVLP